MTFRSSASKSTERNGGTIASPRCSRRQKRRAFTLLELLLVLALMVVIAAIAWPSIKGPFESQRLSRSAEQVRAEFGKLRVRSMRTGQIHVFRFQPGQAGFAWEPWTNSVEDVNSSNIAGNGFGATAPAVLPASSHEDQLPEGIQFHAAEVTLDARASQLLGPGGEAAADAEWSDPIFFYPDGTTSNTHLVLNNTRGQAVIVTLRGLTGLTLASEMTTVDQLSK
jgi:prepilin-type N-terminal cleavage/methylation domain-containing protein